jgi:hypothetical protein
MGTLPPPELPTPPRPPRRLGALNAAALALAVCWLVLVALTLTPETDDFAQLRRGAVDLAEHGDPYYTRTEAAAEARRPAGTVDESGERGFKYTPIFAYLFRPFALLDHRAGQRTWFGVNLAALATLLLLCLRVSGSALGRRYWGVLVLGVVIAPPTRLSLQLGQISLPMALMLVGVFALARRRPCLAGLLLTLASAVKLYPALLLVAYLLRGPRRVAWWGIAWAVLLAAAFLPAYGVGPYRSFAEGVVASGNHPYAAEFNLSFVGFWTRLFAKTPYAVPPLDAPALARALVALSTLATLLVCVGASRRPGGPGRDPLLYSLWLCAMLLLSPINGSYNLVVLLLPLLVVLRLLERAPDRRLRNWLTLGTLLACWPPAWSDPLPAVYNAAHTGWGILVLAPAFYGLLIYFVLLARLTRRPAGERPGGKETLEDR